MNSFFLAIGAGLLFLMVLALYRVVLGPTVIDRIMGVNVIGTKTTVLLIIIGMIYHRVDMFIDIALAYAMLNFIATLSANRYFKRHKNLTIAEVGSRTKKRQSK